MHRTAIVLVHGLSSTPDELLSLQGPLRQLGCTVAPVRIPGYTFDPGAPPGQASRFESWIVALQLRVQQLREDHARVVVVGISAGAALALAAAMHTARPPDALVLLSTTLRYDGWGVSRWRFLLPLAFHTPLGRLWQYREKPPYGVKNERIRAWIARELEQRRISQAGSAVLGVAHLRENGRLVRYVRSQLAAVGTPHILAVHAEEDEVASPRNLQYLRRGLPDSCALQTFMVHNSYHMLTIDNDRQAVVACVLDFVQSLVREVQAA